MYSGMAKTAREEGYPELGVHLGDLHPRVTQRPAHLLQIWMMPASRYRDAVAQVERFRVAETRLAPGNRRHRQELAREVATKLSHRAFVARVVH